MFYSRILAVTTPASNSMLVSLEAAKDELRITDSSNDTRLTRWITEASAVITGYVNRVLRMETVVETLRANSYSPRGFCADMSRDGPWYGNAAIGIRLRRYPVVSMTSIVEDGVLLDPAADYEVDSEAGVVYRLSETWRVDWYASVVVLTYSGGYATADDVPPDIQSACLLMLKHRYAAQGRDPMLQRLSVPGVLDQQFWVGQTTKSQVSGLPPEAEDLVSRFRDVHI